MLKDLINKIQNTIKSFRVWILYHAYTQQAAKNIQSEISEILDEAFEENVEVMNVFKERLVTLYNNDKRN